MEKTNLKALSPDQLTAWMTARGQKPFRARQVERWLYAHRATGFAEMTDLAKTARHMLEQEAALPRIRRVREDASEDGTRKFLFSLPDGEQVETVWIPETDRTTLCISTQVGCAMGCRFCLTAKGGLTRHLAAWEIVEQLMETERLTPADKPVTNVVLMGMGEPLHNLGNVIPALERLVDDQGIAMASRRVTVSTVGLVPQMAELGKQAPYVNLAVSLGAADDETRGRLIPPAGKWPLAEVMAACRNYPLLPRRRILFEYLLIDGVNDSLADARRLVKLVHGVKCKVNLMSMNPIPGEDFARPPEERVHAFQQVLYDAGVQTMVRKSRGRDISAACGQLRARPATVNGQGGHGAPQ